ncbi:Retrovirus-related Pol polyprotein from transposon RE1 [Vitis vinifera]|uniref:Retrovirus-related Pol polyprotein from transposon RE1 n=1 Tax=Vitis vinifera TaxID=29760 RepID=A0A438DZI0_VITVI|nr:Retrovirus-related Pol polyprotein from transposon RE1 [Vitis vinifera]
MLVSQTTSRGGRSGTRGRGQRPHCTYCNKLGHTRDRCYQLHGRPPRTAHMAQSSDSPLSQPPSSSASQTSQASIASVAQPGNASACLTHTSSLGPWILDSGASDHLSGNKDLFSSITTTSDLPTVTLANGSQTVAKGPEYGEDDWHRTLSKFQKMVPRFSTLSSLPCESCQLGKHTRVSFPKRLNNRAKSPFELVHTDVWGPCRTASTLGFQYFVTFIDDYSRSQFTSFMSHHGILHQSSCAHTPQQNGVAERKNRHLVETARTLLLHSHVPFRFWGDAVLTACYLINRQAFRQSHEVPLLGIFQTSEGLSLLFPETHRLAHSHCLPPDVMPPRPLQVYHRRPRVVAPLPFPEAPADSLPILRLHLPRLCLLLMTYLLLFGKSTHEALSHPGWRQAMVDEMAALHSNGTWILLFYPLVDRLKARLVAKAILKFMVLIMLDIKNAFLHGDLAEEVYMEQPPVLLLRGSLCIYLVVYVDDIVITGSDQDDSSISSGVVLSQRKYALDILEETGMLDCKPVDTPMDPNVKLVPGQGEPLGDPGRYRRLPLGCRNPYLRYIKSTPGQGVLYENRGHTQVVGYTDADWAGSPTDRRSTSGYCVFIGGNLISWKSKKQDVVARSSAEAEYRAMALATCELIWLRHLLQELRFGKDEQMKLICDNQAALHIASNPVFHERTKHIEVDCHFIREKIASGCVATSFVNSNDQLADIFTKSLRAKEENLILPYFPCHQLGKPSFLFPVSSTPGNLPVTVFHSGHLPHLPILSGQLDRRQKTLTAGELFRRTFRRRLFPTPTTPRGAPGGDLQLFQKHRTRKPSTRRPRALLRPATESHAPAREAFSGDAPPPPASPDADQHPYLPGSPIRALHVPLLGIFVSSALQTAFPEVSATFSPPQSLHVPWEVFFYLSGGTTSRSEAVSLFRWCHAAI